MTIEEPFQSPSVLYDLAMSSYVQSGDVELESMRFFARAAGQSYTFDRVYCNELFHRLDKLGKKVDVKMEDEVLVKDMDEKRIDEKVHVVCQIRKQMGSRAVFRHTFQDEPDVAGVRFFSLCEAEKEVREFRKICARRGEYKWTMRATWSMVEAIKVNFVRWSWNEGKVEICQEHTATLPGRSFDELKLQRRIPDRRFWDKEQYYCREIESIWRAGLPERANPGNVRETLRQRKSRYDLGHFEGILPKWEDQNVKGFEIMKQIELSAKRLEEELKLIDNRKAAEQTAKDARKEAKIIEQKIKKLEAEKEKLEQDVKRREKDLKKSEKDLNKEAKASREGMQLLKGITEKWTVGSENKNLDEGTARELNKLKQATHELDKALQLYEKK